MKSTPAPCRSSCVMLLSRTLTLLAAFMLSPFAVMNHSGAHAGGAPDSQAGRQLTLVNEQLAWHLDFSDGRLQSRRLENKQSGDDWPLSDTQEVALTFSAAIDRVQEPLLQLTDFRVQSARLVDPTHAAVELRNPSMALTVVAHYQLDGPTRRKWIEVTNGTGKEMLLLDVQLDSLTAPGAITGGGQGRPLFVGDQWFAAIEHPSGENLVEKDRIRLLHHPGRRLKPGETFRSHVALVSVAKPGQAHEHFTDYIESKSLPKKRVSIYTPFGINSQWGGCPALDEEQTLDVLNLLDKWRGRGVHFDYFTLDTGWVDPNSDLTRFNPTGFPNGPSRIVKRVNELGMKFGLWFATTWAAESCWDYPPALAGQPPLSMTYRRGYPNLAAEGRHFCFAAEPYFTTIRNAVLYHIRENNVRLLKFDGGSYHCKHVDHGHLPGKYSTEFMHGRLIDLIDAARAAVPDVIVMWYWGLGSPFWALYGDTIFESGLRMEGSATSVFPTLYYRDSVTIGLDEGTQFARTIPPLVKDSLGVWLANTNWGNYMGKDRWREGLVMDLGRGGLLFPNLWGNLYSFTDADVDFLARIGALSTQNEARFRRRRNILGDPAKNEVYGYANCRDGRGFLFLNNAHFAARLAQLHLDSRIGLEGKSSGPLNVVSHFPDRTRIVKPDGSYFRVGDVCDIWLRPFEVLMLELGPSISGASQLPLRTVTQSQAASLATALTLNASPPDPRLDVRFTDASQFERRKLVKKHYAFQSELPAMSGENPILAVVVRLRQGDKEWRYSPVVCDVVQPRLRIGEQNVVMVPIPDGRQHGNTQIDGCSWVVYKVRLSPQWAHRPVHLAVHAYLPAEVEAQVEVRVVERWWEENTQPSADGYYNDAPS